MNHKSYGQLLFDVIRETLETMAFAEVVPCSFLIGGKEFSGEDESDFDLSSDMTSGTEPKVHPPIQTDFSRAEQSDWGNAVPVAEDSWGTLPVGNGDAVSDSQEANGVTEDAAEDTWGGGGSAGDPGTGSWGKTKNPTANYEHNPWGNTENGTVTSGLRMKAGDINFNAMVENQDDWVWACMRVNSPDVHSVWFVVSKSLAMELANNMYAGEGIQLDSPIIRDLVAELTNVLGGRLMLLLEGVGGQFTLAVPDIGIGLPTMPDSATMETVLCKVLVDGEYPVMSSICFNKK